MKETYIIKYFFSASHYVVIDGKKSMTHPHSWQLEIEGEVKSKEMIDYRLLDRTIEGILEKLEGKVLNEEEEFKEIEPSTENLGRVLMGKFSGELEKIGFIVEKFIISENASRSFRIEKE